MPRSPSVIIQPRTGWQAIDGRELWRHRELLGFLIWRDIRLRYSQTVFGALWAVGQPLLAMIVFAMLFHRLAGLGGADVPYPLFAFVGLVVWLFFANAVTAAAASLIGNQQLISKVYFPRAFIPLAAIGAFVLDLLINLVVLAAMLTYYRRPPTAVVIALPLPMLGLLMASAGTGLILSALNVHYRDVKYAIPFLVQMGLFVTPVAYGLADLPEGVRVMVGMNPMAGIVESFRWCLLGTSVSWPIVALSLTLSAGLFVAGLYLFRRMERQFADVI